MNGYIVLASGMLLLLGGLIAAVIMKKAERRSAIARVWFRTYIFFILFALVIAGLLLLAGFIETWVSVDAYRTLFDILTFGLLGVLFSGLVLVIRRRGFLVSYMLCLAGTFLTFGEFLGR